MPEPHTRLYLVTPPIAAPGDLPGLAAALGAGDVACLLLRLRPMAERAAKDVVRSMARTVQDGGVALLVENGRLAAHAGADGVHVAGLGEPLTEALDGLKPERIVGVGRLDTRDEAMLAGEAGADYLMFGEPADGRHANALDTLDRVRWWAEIFQVPCVGFAYGLDEVEGLARAGADFVALGDAVWASPRGPAAAVARAQAVLARVEVAASEREPS